MSPALHISMATDLSPPTPAHQLLMSFFFGDPADAADHPAVVCPLLQPIDREAVYENWWVEGDITYSQRGSMRIAECNDFAVVVWEGDELDTQDHQQYTHDAYRDLFAGIQSTQHQQPVKIWNYLGNINEGDGDDERYRQFSVGRAIAFNELGIDDVQAPTGTGVGTMEERGLSIIALCSSQDFALAENPRQVSAFDYPRQYGPKSPKFGRAGSVRTPDYRLHLISGTAAIVGHESMHPDDTEAQLDETLRNLDSLCEAISAIEDNGPAFELDAQCVLRVYLRDPNERGAISRLLLERLGHDASQVVFLHGDICRRELMVEIDGVRIQ